MVNWTEVTPRFSYAWLHNHKISAMKLNGADRLSVDAWLNYSIETRTMWDNEAPLLILSDHRNSDLITTPYFRQLIPRLMAVRPDLQTYVAFILDQSMGAQNLAATLRVAPSGEQTVMRIFHEDDEAIEWLLSQTS